MTLNIIGSLYSMTSMYCMKSICFRRQCFVLGKYPDCIQHSWMDWLIDCDIYNTYKADYYKLDWYWQFMYFFLGVPMRLARKLRNINFIDKVATGQAGRYNRRVDISWDCEPILTSLLFFLFSSRGFRHCFSYIYSKYQSAEYRQ